MKNKIKPSKKTVNDWLKKTIFSAIFISVFSSQAGTTYDLNKSVIASGGETVGGQYQLQGAIGQPITTRSSSSTYQLTAGFYQENRDLIFTNEFESNQ